MASLSGLVAAQPPSSMLRAPLAKAVAAFVLLPTLLCFVVLRRLGEADPALIDLGLLALLLVAMLAGRLRPAAAGLLLALALPLLIAVRIAWTVCGVFLEFATPASLASYWQFVDLWPWRTILLAMAPLPVIGWLAWRMARTLPWRRMSPLPVLALLVLIPVTERLLPRPALANVNLSGSNLDHLAKVATAFWNRPPFTVRPVADPAYRAMATASGDRILSIGIESLGLPVDRAGRMQMAGQLAGLFGPGYRAELRTVAARNSTLPGELRVLCGVAVSGLPDPDDVVALADRCLPARLAANGWQTHGLHGNSGRFYARSVLYPALGFGVTRFRESFDAAGMAPCPTVSNVGGWCDAVVAAEAMRLLAGPGKRFAHMMSLDTHLPVLGAVPGCAAGNQLCGHEGRMRSSLAAIAAAVGSAGAGAAPDLIVLWGDHPPPFLDGADRAAFDTALVPVVIYRRL